MDSSTSAPLDRSISNRSVPVYILLLSCFIEIQVLNASRVDYDRMPHSGVSDHGLYCLPMSLLWNIRHKWVKQDPQTKTITTVERNTQGDEKRKKMSLDISNSRPSKSPDMYISTTNLLSCDLTNLNAGVSAYFLTRL